MAVQDGRPPGPEPISRANRFQGSQTDYQTVVSWSIPEGKQGELEEISLVHDTAAGTQFRLTINGKVQWEDRLFQRPLTIPFGYNRLPEKAVVLLEACSTSGAVTVTVDGHISGTEEEVAVLAAEGLALETLLRRYAAEPGAVRETLARRFLVGV